MVKNIRYGNETYACKKVKGKKMLICGLKKKKSTKRKTSRKKGGRKSHKGHRTKRGLAQDQRLKSQEPHEKAYRKAKRKGTR